jgi:hypothetical protein
MTWVGRETFLRLFLCLWRKKRKEKKSKVFFFPKKKLSKAMQEIFERKLVGNRLSTYFRAIILELSTMGKTFNL